MGYLKTGVVMGIFFVFVLSLVLTPLICKSIKMDNSDVTCNLESQLKIFGRIYTQTYTPLLIIFGGITGILITKLSFKITKREYIETEIEKKNERKKYDWPWEKK